MRFGGTRRLNLIADIFNLFNRQAITQLDQRYNLVSDGPCAGIPDGLCNGDGGIVTTGNTLTPAGAITQSARDGDQPRLPEDGPDSQTRGSRGRAACGSACGSRSRHTMASFQLRLGAGDSNTRAPRARGASFVSEIHSRPGGRSPRR